MRGEVCISISSLLSFTASLLLLFAHVGQINLSTVPRGISTVKIDMTGYSSAYEDATGDKAPNLFNTTGNPPVGLGLGLRHVYKWGFYGYCAYNDTKLGSCSNSSTAGFHFQPLKTILADVPSGNLVITKAIISSVPTTFNDNGYLGTFSSAAYFLTLLGTISAVIALVTGPWKHEITFTAAAFFSLFGTLCLLIGGSIFTAITSKVKSINNVTLTTTGSTPVGGTNTFPLGIIVSTGNAVYLVWVAFAFLALSCPSYVITAVTYAKRQTKPKPKRKNSRK